MRILVVTHYYSTHRGGIEIVAGRLAALLARAHDVTWAASDCDDMPSRHEGVRFLPMRSINAIERLTGLPFPIWAPGSIARLARAVREGDVVHVHDFIYLGSWAAFVCARYYRKPFVVTQHVGFIPYRSALLRAILGLVHATVGRFVLGRADQVVFISRVVRDYYEDRVRFRRPPLLIENGVDTKLFAPIDQAARLEARAALGLDPLRPLLLFVGRFVEKKGVHVLEALARRMTGISWVFAGWGAIDPRRWELPNVHVFSDRRGGSLAPLYQAADLLVLPSVGEGLPLVVQESMSCGTPAIVGEDTAKAIDAPSGLVFGCGVGGADAVAVWEEKIDEVLADTGATDDRRRAVAAFAASRWSWPACASSYASLFAELETRRTLFP